MPLYAGVCETNITPPIGTWMSGYAARNMPAQSVHDELFAKALVIDDGTNRIVLMSADIIAFDNSFVPELKQKISVNCGISPEYILLNATHTHGGPYLGTYFAMGSVDTAYRDVFIKKMIGIAKQASQNLIPAHLTYGESSAQIGVNRRQTLANGKTVLGVN